jgi:hypothetical protein
MFSHRIKFDRWANGPQREHHRPVVWQPFRLRIFSPDGVFQFAFSVLHAEVPTGLRLILDGGWLPHLIRYATFAIFPTTRIAAHN